MDRPTWTEYFMNMVYLVASRSPDESTKVGAVIVRPDYSVVSTGYNGFPPYVRNTQDRQERPRKYFFFTHAEANSIILSAKNGHCTRGCFMYTNGIPCADCARLIIGAGISKVFTDKNWEQEKYGKNEWDESISITREMFNEADVELMEVENFELM